MPNPKVKMNAKITSPRDGATVTVGPQKKLSVSIDAWGIILRGGGSGGGSGPGGDPPGGGKKPPGGGVQPKGGHSLQGNGESTLQHNVEIEAGRVLVKLGDGDFNEATKMVPPRRWRYSETVRRAGNLKITAKAVRPAGHQGEADVTTHTVNVVVDRDAPELTINRLPSIPDVHEVEVPSGSRIAFTVSGSVSDADSGVKSLHVGVDEASEEVELDGEHWEHELTLTGFQRHDVHLRAVDGAGNQKTERRRVETVDSGRPDLQVTSPPDGDTVAWPDGGDLTVEFQGRASDDGSGVKSVGWRLGDDGQFTNAEDTSARGDWRRWKARVPLPALGEHEIHFRARDKAGNERDIGVTLHAADLIPPEVRITEPPADPHEVVEEEGGVTVDVRGRAEDAVGEVSAVEWSLDGGDFERADPLDDDWSEWRFSVHLEEPGEHPVRVRATDTSGNTSEPRELTVKVLERV